MTFTRQTESRGRAGGFRRARQDIGHTFSLFSDSAGRSCAM
jgi:hypothetical protein